MNINRRQLLAGAGTAAAATAVVNVGGAPTAGAQTSLTQARPMPSPVPGFILLDPSNPASPEIHAAIPGPEGLTTQIFGFPTDGPNAEGTTITNFNGTVAFGIASGTSRDQSGAVSNVEADIRVMQGDYIAEDGTAANATFMFL